MKSHLRVCVFMALIFMALLLSSSQALSQVAIGKGCTTAFYIDKDCDGYGVGTGYVTGMDADDEDYSINDLASVEAVYGELDSGDPLTAKANLLNFLANRKAASYTGINDVFYISPSGNDTTGKPNDYNYPFATFNSGVSDDSSFGAGDLIVWREGAYDTYMYWYKHPGAEGSPIVCMSFPGEKAILQEDDSVLALLEIPSNTSWLVFDTMQFGPDTGYTVNNGWHTGTSYTQHDLIMRYSEFINVWTGTRLQYGLYNILMEYCVSHHNTGGGRHTNYWGGTGCYNQTIRGCIFYANVNEYPLFQWNGWEASNLRWEGCIFHSGGQVGLSLLVDVDDSYVVNCLFFNNNRNDIIFYTYPEDWYGQCDNNQIINNTFWRGNTSNQYSSSDPSDYASIALVNSADSVPHTGNLFRNNVWHTTDSPIFDTDNSLTMDATDVDHNVMYRQSGSTIATVGGSSYTFSQFEAGWADINSNKNSDPLFEDVSVDYVLTPGNFDFDPTSGSPVINFGTSTNAPDDDLRNYTRSLSIPDAGCYETPYTQPPVAPTGLKRIQ